jgi:ribosomal protein S18 acetylase RimI-like enzyme
MIEIKKLKPDKWKDYRDLRLDALKNEPLAFASSYREEKNITRHEWKKRSKNALFAVLGDKPIGMIVYLFNDKIKTKHIAHIFGVYVKKEYRGREIGKNLIEDVLKIIEENVNISKIRLIINPDQKAAVKIYENFGFDIVGRLKNELRVDDKYYDGLIMEKFL